jgi:hypothetical protein
MEKWRTIALVIANHGVLAMIAFHDLPYEAAQQAL